MKILLFDYDGTIVNSMDSVYHGFNHATRAFQMPLKSKEQIAQLYLNNIFSSLLKIGVPKSRLNEFMNKMREGYAIKKVKPFPKMKSILASLKKDHKIFIITSNYKKTIKKSILKNNIKVDGVFGKEQGQSKVKKIKSIKQKYPKSDIIYIGDTAGDMKESRKARVKNIAVTWGYNTRKQLLATKPDYIINKPVDLLKILK